MSLTGVGVTLNSTDADVKFSATEAWKITRVGGLPRSVVVIDDSHLGLVKGAPHQYCFGELVQLGAITVEAQVDTDSTTVFQTVNSVTSGDSVPIPLGEVTGAGNAMILTLPKNTSSTSAQLTMTGAYISDSGVDYVNNDRPRSTFQFQPDGKTFSWSAPA